MAYVLAVGQQYPGWVHPLPEGGEFNISDEGPILKLYYQQPVEEEIRNFRNGRIRIGLLNAGIHTFFFLFDIYGVTAGWSDGSFALGLVAPENRKIDFRPDNQGWLLRMLLIDANSGIIASMRACTFTPTFSSILDKLVDDQHKALSDFSQAKHDAEIAVAHARWSSPSDMVKDALITEIAGQRFRDIQRTVGKN